VYVYFLKLIPFESLMQTVKIEDRFLYNQIVISEDLVRRYFASKQLKQEQKETIKRSEQEQKETNRPNDILILIQKVYNTVGLTKGDLLNNRILDLWNSVAKLHKSEIETIEKHGDLPIKLIMMMLERNPSYPDLVKQSKEIINDYISTFSITDQEKIQSAEIDVENLDLGYDSLQSLPENPYNDR